MNEANQVIERLIKVLNAKNNAELANLLGVAYNTISTWRNRNSIPYHVCMEIAKKKKVSLDWLLLGRGPVYWQEYPLFSELTNNAIQDDSPPLYLTAPTLKRPLLIDMEIFLKEFYELKGRIDRLEKQME